MIEMINLK